MTKTTDNTKEAEEITQPEMESAKNHEDHVVGGINEDSETQEYEVNQDSEATEEAEELDPMEVLQQEVIQLKDTLLRRSAEFDNVKKRMLRERMQLLTDAKIEALKNFLPVNDDLQRTLQAADGQDIPQGFLQGITMVYEKFGNILKAAGVEEINESGIPFDVNVHDALMRQPAPDDNTPSDTVLQVLEPGYKAGDKVIRHAKVIVSE
ncbi:MAG: nucleotide exchange factor GrpE [Balneolales bacterium]|nr:nucleotide exchange factor GrpE [Balneolales bacterium]